MKHLSSSYIKSTTLIISLFVLLFAATKANAQWVELGGATAPHLDNDILSIATDAGGNVYAGGEFYNVTSSFTANYYVSKWNGIAWTKLGDGDDSLGGIIHSIATDAIGNVYVAHDYGYVAEWNGITWTKLGSPFNGSIYSIATDGGGNVYAGGFFTMSNKFYLVKWSGTAWIELGSPFNGPIFSIATDADGNVYAVGEFTDANGHNYVAKWNGTAWSELGGNSSPFIGGGKTITTDASGNVYTTGAGASIYKWNGTTWSQLGADSWPDRYIVNSITTDASGNVYAGGEFLGAIGNYNYMLKWDGTEWSELGGTPFNYTINTVATDAGGNVYAGGGFGDSRGSRYVAEYPAQAGNTPITVNIVNPNPSLINSSGTIYVNTSQIDTTQTVAAAVTDGITKLLLVTSANYPLTFSVADNDGSVSSLADQKTLAKQITIAPDANGKVVAVYTVPDGYGVTNPVGGRNAAVTIADAGNAGHYTTANIKLVTPPLVMVHGIWSDPSIWDKGGFTSSLAANGIRNIYLADYSQVSSSTYDPNSFESFVSRMSIQIQIDKALNDYQDQRIAVAQVDVVGHSLGGLMTRSLSQQSSFLEQRNYYKGFVHKLITLGTPHRGSPLGPELYKYKDSLDYFHVPGTDHTVLYPLSAIAQLIGMPIGSCLKDFGITSQGIADLSTTLPYRTFSITADHEGDGNIGGDLTGYPAMEALCLTVFHKPFEEIMESRCNTGVLPNDLIVPYKSQTGYINSTQNFYGTCHSIPGLLTETNNPLIQEKVAELLLSDDTTEFSIGFPAPSSFPLNNCDNATEVVVGSNQPLTRTTTVASLAGNLQPTGKEYVQISAPARETVYHQNIDTVITVGYEPLGGSIPTNALLIIKDVDWYKLPTTPPYSTTVTLPKNVKTGSLNMVLMVSDTTGINLVDTSHIVFLPSGILNNISIQPTSLLFDSLNRQTRMLIQEEYAGIYGTYLSDISDTADGITYTTQKGNSIIDVAADGTVTAVSAGIDTLTVRVGDSTFIVPVNVDSNFLSRTLYPNVIDFTDIPDKTESDAPFALDATTTSGNNVTFTLISGPVDILNGVVYIKGSGTVTIQATTTGNAYFDSAAPVIKTFYINNALPLQLLTFKGSLVNSNVLLNWTTANEVNTSYFIVERSTDEIHFTDIGTVNAASNNSGAGNYYFKDQLVNTISASPVYYRLKEIDKDGKQTLSNIISITLGSIKKIVVYPNPAKRIINLLLNQSLEGDSYLKLYDMMGKQIIIQKLTSGLSQQVHLPTVSNGNYKIVILSNGKVVHQQSLIVSM